MDPLYHVSAIERERIVGRTTALLNLTHMASPVGWSVASPLLTLQLGVERMRERWARCRQVREWVGLGLNFEYIV